MAAKPKLAVFKFASCDGCQLSLLDCEDELLAVAGAVDIRYFLEAGVPEGGPAAGQGPVDELAEGVPQQPGLVEELPGAGVPARLDELRGGGGQLVPQGGDCGLDQVGGAGGVPGQVT